MNDLLDAKQIESGSFKPKFEEFAPSEVFYFVTEMFQEQAQMQKTSIRIVELEAASHDKASLVKYDRKQLREAKLPGVLHGDCMRLKQILINLVKNALKFTNSGSICVFVAFDSLEQLLKVHVVDTGKGIDPREMDQLFTKFGKLKRTAKQNSEGIGLGLLICKGLVEGSGGSMLVESDGVDKGSTFGFTMRMFDTKAAADQF